MIRHGLDSNLRRNFLANQLRVHRVTPIDPKKRRRTRGIAKTLLHLGKTAITVRGRREEYDTKKKHDNNPSPHFASSTSTIKKHNK